MPKVEDQVDPKSLGATTTDDAEPAPAPKASQSSTTLDDLQVALQMLVDKFQDKVEKEIIRTLKVRPVTLRVHLD